MKWILPTLLLISHFSYSQTRWHPYGGVHASVDAAAYFAGPSLQAGIDHTLKKNWALSMYFHYWPDGFKKIYPGNLFEREKFRSGITAFLIQKYFSKQDYRKVFLALGMALQVTKDDYVNSFDEEHLKRTLFIPAIRFGYQIPLPHHSLAIELNGVGPYIGEMGPPPYYDQTIEILTQLSFGVRFVL